MRVTTVLMAVLVAVTPFASNAGDTNRYDNQQVGLVVEKPHDWYFMTVQSMIENRERVRYSDEELTELVRRRASEPLVVIAKYENPAAQPDVTPTVQIGLRPLGALKRASAEEMLEIVLRPMQQGVDDFRLVKPIHGTSVSGLGAAHAVVDYGLANQGGATFEVRARLWVVPRGDLVFIVGMSGPQEGADVSEEEFQTILRSISIVR